MPLLVYLTPSSLAERHMPDNLHESSRLSEYAVGRRVLYALRTVYDFDFATTFEGPLNHLGQPLAHKGQL